MVVDYGEKCHGCQVYGEFGMDRSILLGISEARRSGEAEHEHAPNGAIRARRCNCRP